MEVLYTHNDPLNNTVEATILLITLLRLYQKGRYFQMK